MISVHRLTSVLPADPAGPALTISAAARTTGIPQATLRAWHRRYGLSPSRLTTGGHRRYTPADIRRLRAVKDLIDDGVLAGEAVRSVLLDGDDHADDHADDDAPQPRLKLPPEADPITHHVGAAVLDLDGPATRRLLRDHLARHDAATTSDRIVRPVLAAIRQQTPDNPHSAFIEQFLTHIAAGILGETLPTSRQEPDPKPWSEQPLPGEQGRRSRLPT